MIKPEELRLGNWVHHKDKWSYRQPDRDLKEFDFQWDESDWHAMGECTLFFESDISPIRIDEPWLLKFGLNVISNDVVGRFGNEHEGHKIYSEEGKTHTGFNVHHVVSNYGGIPHTEIQARRNGDYIASIEYVHQLQNLYFALTNKELTIKP